jgi:hypothetical protein
VRLHAAQADVWGPVVLDVVKALYRRGDFRLLAQFTESFPPASLRETDGFTARAAARMGDFAKSLEFAARMRAAGDPAWQAVEGYARARAGFVASGEQLLREACGSIDAEVRSEAGYRLAILQWSRGEADDAEATLRLYLREDVESDATLRYEMLGWIEVARRRHALAGPYFRRAFEAHETSRVRDEWRRQRLLHALTIVALETLDFALLRGLEIHDATLGSEAREPACYATQNRGWLTLLAGHEIDALDFFQQARALASSPALVAMTEVNLASYHRLRDSRGSAADHLAIARAYFRRQDWSRANVDERMGLLEYAIEAYQLDRHSAGEMLTRYLSTELRRFVALSLERHAGPAHAIELTARGVLEAIHGRNESAQRNLEKAVRAWGELGYRFRVLTTALLLHAVSADARDLDAAHRVARVVPRSWLAREVARRQQPHVDVAAVARPQRRVVARSARPRRAVS